MNLEKIIEILSFTGGGPIVNIQKENNDLNIYIEVFGYLAEHFNKKKVKRREDRHFWILKYKIIDIIKIELIDYDNDVFDENGIFENLSEIIDMDFRINNVEIGEKGNIEIKLWSHKNNGADKDKIPFCILYLMANDIKIYNIKNKEIDYNEFIKFMKEYEEKPRNIKK
jgi:hypothetical protein